MMSISTAQQLTDMISIGKPKEAMIAAREHEMSEGTDPSLDFQFQYALASGLAGYDNSDQYMAIMDHPDCTQQMRGDAFRDLAMTTFRLGRHNDAWFYLLVALEMFGDDLNRVASVDMFAARFFVVEGKFEEALVCHERAHELWQIAPDADPQWIRNNLFYWLRDKALLELPRRIVYKAYQASGDTRPDRQRDAALFFWTGRLGAIASMSRETAAGLRLQARTAIENLTTLYEVTDASHEMSA